MCWGGLMSVCMCMWVCTHMQACALVITQKLAHCVQNHFSYLHPIKTGPASKAVVSAAD